MPHAVVDAWQALAAETSSPDTCMSTARAGSAAYDRRYATAAEDATAQVLRRRLCGWRELADDDRRPLNGAEPDQFRLARALGEEDPDGEEETADREGVIDKLRRLGPVEVMRPETLAWFTASMPSRGMATDLVVRITRKTLIAGEGAEVMEAFGRQNGFDQPVSIGRAIEVRNRLQEIAIKYRGQAAEATFNGLARAWSVLAADLAL
ncbi:MAG TPA: hypothetical protein VD863_15310, partial [Bradyrhizobium sp.]|nr:hypothetical protein [Bradyrhizobium sp.]